LENITFFEKMDIAYPRGGVGWIETILDETLTTHPTTCKGLFRPTVASVKKTVFTASTLNSFSLDFAFPFLDLITHCI